MLQNLNIFGTWSKILLNKIKIKYIEDFLSYNCHFKLRLGVNIIYSIYTEHFFFTTLKGFSITSNFIVFVNYDTYNNCVTLGARGSCPLFAGLWGHARMRGGKSSRANSPPELAPTTLATSRLVCPHYPYTNAEEPMAPRVQLCIIFVN